MKTESGTGCVTSVYGRRVVINTSDGQTLDCTTASRKLSPLCGDQVVWQALDNNETAVTEILERRNTLLRHDARLGQRPLAANLDLILVVSALQPDPSPELIDRYLVAAEVLAIPACLILNKIDTSSGNAEKHKLQEYLTIGYDVHTVSAKKAVNLDALQSLLADKTSVLVGQSGVGKSSLIAAMCPGYEPRTQTLSESSGEGRHTTTTSQMYPMDNGGSIIDSPGVRDYRLWQIEGNELAAGFREFRPHIGLCKFHNCRHLDEPGCTIKQAVGEGTISQRRYDSYSDLYHKVTA